jgi:hypothetical protein
MATIQWEDCLVIEIPHPVHPVMALEAAAPQVNLVSNHKTLVIECMASKAGLQDKFILITFMAALAGNNGAVEVHPV